MPDPRQSSNDNSSEPEVYVDTKEEARTTLNHQIQAIKDTATFSFDMLRLNIVLLGALLSAVPVAGQLGITLTGFINIYTIFGISFLFISVLAAAIAHTITSMSVGIDPDGIKTLLDEQYDKNDFDKILSKSYSNWISFNDRISLKQNLAFVFSMALFIDSLLFMCAGFVAGVYTPNFGSRSSYVVLTLIIAVSFDAALFKASGYSMKSYKRLKKNYIEFIFERE